MLRILAVLALVACQSDGPAADPGGAKVDADGSETTSGSTEPTIPDEVCDGIDNDGDGRIDEGLLTVFHEDADGDGAGNPDVWVYACEAPKGYVRFGDDCDDTDELRYSDAVDGCDGVDNDCDGLLDEDHRSDWWLGTVNDGVLYEVDVTNADFIEKVVLTGEGAGMTINSTDSFDGNLIVVHNLGMGAGTLQDLDSCTGELNTIGNTGTGSLPGISFGPDGNLYAVEAGSDMVIRIDPADATWGTLVPLGFPLQNSGAAYDCSTERIWVADQVNSRIFWFDPLTGVMGGFQDTNVPFASVGLEWHPQSRTLYASTGTELWTIDPATGDGTYIGDFPTALAVGTLALFPSCP